VVEGIKALTFDTGGTVLHWHRGMTAAFSRAAARHGIAVDADEVAKSYRRQSLESMVGVIGHRFNIDDVHRRVLDEVIRQHGLSELTDDDREEIWRTWHELEAWPDFPPALARLREKLVVVSFSILSTSLIIDVSRKNGLTWDCIISCEMIGVYKTHPESYRIAAKLLGFDPSEIMMVACHNFDLLAARREGYRSAFVHRPDEWGPLGPPDPVPDPSHDLVTKDFSELADALGA
jgi:2-haloacid dehalogenase